MQYKKTLFLFSQWNWNYLQSYPGVPDIVYIVIATQPRSLSTLESGRMNIFEVISQLNYPFSHSNSSSLQHFQLH